MSFLLHLHNELDRLAELANQVRASGSIAPAQCWEDYVVKRNDKQYHYKRVNGDRPQFGQGGQAHTLHLGKAGNPKHRDWQQRIQRRETLAEIERRVALIQQLIDRESAYPLEDLDSSQKPESSDNA
jgi:hypothetical protein